MERMRDELRLLSALGAAISPRLQLPCRGRPQQIHLLMLTSPSIMALSYATWSLSATPTSLLRRVWLRSLYPRRFENLEPDRAIA